VNQIVIGIESRLFPKYIIGYVRCQC